jgi:hypothetical protein
VTVLPPQGFRHAVDLLITNSIRSGHVDAEQLARDLVALGNDMHAAPEFAAWVASEYERMLLQPAPAVLASLGHRRAEEPRDFFITYVPEDRLPLAAPLAVELAKRRVRVAFSGYEVESDAQLAAAVARGLEIHRAGGLLVTPAFVRRGLRAPTAHARMKILDHTASPTTQADGIRLWISKLEPAASP